MARLVVAALAAVLVSACAATPKNLNPADSVKDGANAKAAAPAPATDPNADAKAAAQKKTDEEASSCGLVRVRFGFDSAILDDSAKKALQSDAECLSKRHPASLLIEGHCDERGTTEYNIALGARRADAVKTYLAALGVKTSFDTVSFGKEIPVAQGEGESAWSQNRRAELRLPGDKRSDGQLVSAR